MELFGSIAIIVFFICLLYLHITKRRVRVEKQIYKYVQNCGGQAIRLASKDSWQNLEWRYQVSYRDVNGRYQQTECQVSWSINSMYFAWTADPNTISPAVPLTNKEEIIQDLMIENERLRTALARVQPKKTSQPVNGSMRPRK